MQWMEMHAVGFGECIVLGGKRRDILMVDCGSLNSRLHSDWLFSDYVRRIARKYGAAEEKTFLLTHFHKDHYGGLPILLQENPDYFNRIYLPNCPLDSRGMPLLLELAIFTDCFLPKQTLVSRMTAGTLRVFDKIGNLAGTERIYALQAGDCFEFDGVTYDALWPPRERYPFSESCIVLSQNINRILEGNSNSCVQAFLELKDDLCMAYLRCMDAFSLDTDADEQERLDCMEDITLLIQDLDYLIPSLLQLSVADKITSLLCGQTWGRAYSDAVNGASLIIQNRGSSIPSYDDLLLTGDATPSVMDRISSFLHESYYVVKAPHHGTKSGWWEGFLSKSISHLLISNGTGGFGGKIDAMYPQMNVLHHCTSADVCTFVPDYGCCNRTLFCEEASPRSGAASVCKREGCNIFISGIQNHHSCLCDKIE